MHLLARVAALTGAMLVALSVPGVPLLAAPDSGSVTTVPVTEAWYRSSPTCTTPLGCAAATTSYPVGTFHVGVTLGTEDSRSYLQLDLTKLPSGTQPTGGRLRLPLAPASDGTSNPEAATLRACLAPQPVREAQGTATADPPTVECDGASVDAVFVPAAGDLPAAFTVDLAALAGAWQAAAAPGALALLPGEGTTQADRWHLAFNEQGRVGDGLVKPIVALTYTGSTVDAAAPQPPLVTAPVESDTSPVAPVTSEGLVLPGSASVESALVPSSAGQASGIGGPAVAAKQPTVNAVAFTTGGFRYPVVFLLPLLIAGVAAWLGRALTRDLGGF